MAPDAARFERLLVPHHAALRRFARSLCRSRADGDDLLQAALMRALGKLGALRDDGAFRAWVYRIVISVHHSRARRAFWKRLVPLGGEPEAAQLALPEAVGGASRARLALAKLPAEQREAIVLFEIEGWTVEELAALLDVSPSAIKSRLARGRARLREIYQRQFGVALEAAPGGAP